jgi:hypothetical protein
VMDAEARKAAKARYRAAMAAAQNGRRLMLRDMEQYKAGLIDLQGIQVPHLSICVGGASVNDSCNAGDS